MGLTERKKSTGLSEGLWGNWGIRCWTSCLICMDLEKCVLWWIASVFRLNDHSDYCQTEGESWLYDALQNIFNKQNIVTNYLSVFVHLNTAHLVRSSSCLLLTQTASAHLLAAVRPIISLPPFLCSNSSSLGCAQGRGGKGGRRGEERGEGSSPLTSS